MGNTNKADMQGGTQKKNLEGPVSKRLGRRQQAEKRRREATRIFSSLGPAILVRVFYFLETL